MFPVTVADYISRPESQSRQNLPQKENHAGPEPKVQAATHALAAAFIDINQDCGPFSAFPTFYTHRRTGPAPRCLSERPPSVPPAKAWPRPARPWPWSTVSRKETAVPLANPSLEQDSMAKSVPACINLNLKQMSEKYLTKYLNSYYESEKVQKNDKRIYLKTHVNGVCYPIYQYLVLI